ncbi:ATP-binding protein [Streptomyces sp. MJP52]|uniref:sensor histidine kinase n=1 Tax=Streptomyces sp. MJP52 TaxID=2940555 RepID=UPI0024739D87|nr:ATP-binding protein [Streptomyces sp. MJP52]MDH6223302.1 signal transduction histidine kinase [Streptomyces sp. MJP52]
MSHLRAPADRRSPQQRHLPPLGPQLSRIAVLPPVAVTLGGGAAVLYVLLTAGAPTGPVPWAVLAGAVALAAVAVAAAAVAARRAAHSVSARVEALCRRVDERTAELRAAATDLGVPDVSSEGDGARDGRAEADDFGRLADALGRAHHVAMTTLARAASGAVTGRPAAGSPSGAGLEQRIEVFVNVARRLQSLAHREIAVLDELEREIEDPDLLRGLFHVDHLATRVRRHAENLAVLGGAVSRRQWSEPIPLDEVLRSAVAEVEQYARVRVVPSPEGALQGHAVADVIHLLAELVENATVFSPPHTQVTIRADAVAAGLAVEVEDRGLGMPSEEQERMNALLADPASVDVAGLLADGRIGLYVVSQLARRHGVRVRLGGNIYGGVQAVLVLPQSLLGTRPAELPPAASDAPADDGSGGAAVTGSGRREAGERPGAPSPAGGTAEAPGPDPVAARPDGPAPSWAGGAPQGSPHGTAGGGTAVVPGPRPEGAGNDGAAAGTAVRAEARPAPEDLPAASTPTSTPTPTATPSSRAGSGAAPPGGTADPTLLLTPPAGPSAGGVLPGPAVRHTPRDAPEGGTRRPAAPRAGSPCASAAPEGTAGYAPGGPEADHPYRPVPGAMPEAWRQTDRGAGETVPPVPSPSAAEPTAGPPYRAPLPVREDTGRPTPAGALPGFPPASRPPAPGPADSSAPAVHPGAPGGSAADATASRPRLPRRLAQSHLAPQLRSGPAPRPEQAHGEETGHDPHLMAAFRRGVGLAEARDDEDRRFERHRPGNRHGEEGHLPDRYRENPADRG